MGFIGRIAISCVMAAFFGYFLAEAGVTSKDTPRRFWVWNIALNSVLQVGLFFVPWR